MNNDQHLLEERYSVVSEGKPFGMGSRLWSGAKSKLGFTSTQRARGAAASTFAKNVNQYYDQFNAWLVTQPDQRLTVGNLVKFFNDKVGLSTAASPTLTKLTQTDPQMVTSTYNEFIGWFQQQAQPQQPAAQPAPQPQQPAAQPTTAVQTTQPTTAVSKP